MYLPRVSFETLAGHAVALAALALAGCGGGPYRVEIGLPPGTAGEQVEVRVLASCGSTDVLTRTVVTRGQPGMVLGALPRGSYGIEALVYDAGCNLVAEGCVMVDATGAGGTIRVETSSTDLRDCRDRDACMCTLMPTDAGPADGGTDAGCTDCDDDGRCEDLDSSRSHCGMCGNACMPGDQCRSGACG